MCRRNDCQWNVPGPRYVAGRPAACVVSGRAALFGHIIPDRIRAIIFPTVLRKEIVMLNRYFIRPATADRIRASWIGGAIERYVISGRVPPARQSRSGGR